MSTLLNPYSPSETWLRGNIHTHTTASDGEHAPQEVVDWYASRGYDFLAITDHNLLVEPGPLESHGMALLRGEELTAQTSHVLGLGISSTLPAGDQTQDQVDAIRSEGGLAIICHPHWMGLSVEQIAAVQGHLGIEISNQVCFRLNGKGDSVPWWDSLLATGHRCWAFAVDDMHRASTDAGYGWLEVQAEKNPDAILEALSRGSFVATTGPHLEAVEVTGDRVSIRAADCALIRFIGREGKLLYARQCGPEDSLTQAWFELPEDEPFVRVEILDHHGRRAWTQPFWRTAAA